MERLYSGLALSSGVYLGVLFDGRMANCEMGLSKPEIVILVAIIGILSGLGLITEKRKKFEANN